MPLELRYLDVVEVRRSKTRSRRPLADDSRTVLGVGRVIGTPGTRGAERFVQ